MGLSVLDVIGLFRALYKSMGYRSLKGQAVGFRASAGVWNAGLWACRG